MNIVTPKPKVILIGGGYQILKTGRYRLEILHSMHEYVCCFVKIRVF